MTENANMPEMISVDDAARALNLNTSTIRRWIKDGTLPALRVGGKILRIKRTDLQALLDPVCPQAKGDGADANANAEGLTEKPVAEPVDVVKTAQEQGQSANGKTADDAVDGDEILSVAQAAQILGRTPETVRSAIRGKKLQAQKIGDSYIIRRSDVVEYGIKHPCRKRKNKPAPAEQMDQPAEPSEPEE